jgi:hypothetical protein
MQTAGMLAAILLATLINSTPLNDIGPAPWAYGYIGGLYENGANFDPADHLAIGLQRAAAVKDPVFLAIGFGETRRIFDAFTAMARSDPRVNRDIAFVNAACDGCDFSAWIPPRSESTFNVIRSSALAPAGLTEKQVQVIWMQLVTNAPLFPLPQQDGDAYRLKGSIATALRALKARYPNLQIVYLSSRVYGGYATTDWNPEPFAYESALSVRWIVMGQISWERTGGLWDTRIGNIDDTTGNAAWVAWGPYLWADGTMPRSDGLTWQRDDFEADGETLSPKGAQKGAELLLQFLLAEPTAGWFRAPDSLLRPRAVRH